MLQQYFLLVITSYYKQDFGPKSHQLGGLEGRAEPGLVVDAQLGDLNQTTTKNTLAERLKRLNNQPKFG